MSSANILGARAPVAKPDREELAYFASKRREQWRRVLLPLAGVACMVTLWWAVVTAFDVKSFIAPSPQLVVSTIIQKWSLLLQNLVPTAMEALGGFFLGNFAAIVLATLFVHSKAMEKAFFPIAVIVNTIPIVATAPILVLLMGNGMEPKIAIASLICFFPMLVNMVRGLEAVNPQSMELMRVLSANRREVFFKLRVFNSLPYFFSALKIAASTCFIGAVVGEWIGSTKGIGALIIQATYNFDSALLYAAVFMSSCAAGIFFLVIIQIERLVVRWQPASTH